VIIPRRLPAPLACQHYNACSHSSKQYGAELASFGNFGISAIPVKCARGACDARLLRKWVAMPAPVKAQLGLILNPTNDDAD
jgi:hypothetical protein